MLPSPHAEVREGSDGSEWFDAEAVLPIAGQMLPSANEVVSTSDAVGGHAVNDVDGGQIGRVISTMPEAAQAKGYRGPTEALLSLGDDNEILAVRVLRSHDTTDHVDAVRANAGFLNQFIGMKLGGIDDKTSAKSIDGVSGATLTSLAMAEGIYKRMGKASGSLIFSRPLHSNDATQLFQSASSLRGDPVARVVDASGTGMGTILRTGAFVDEEIGYQGPTELLIALDRNQRIESVRIRQSFDNEPYVDYVRTEQSFWQLFTGKTIDELADWDPAQQQVEGVSGATMTSMAVAYTLPEVARKLKEAGGTEMVLQQQLPRTTFEKVGRWFARVRLPAGESALLAILIGLFVSSRFHWMHRRSFRSCWLLLVVVVVGAWTGNLVSLALLAGWASAGVSWHLAVGLLAISAVAFLLPPMNKSNPYCSHLCPHGAMQQLIRPGSKSRRRIHLPRKLTMRLGYLPAITLAVVYLVLLLAPSTDVSASEPFHAYSWRIASWTSIAFSIATLAFSAFVPMGYCRLGCPTGRLIDHLRLGAKSKRITTFDWGAILLLLVAIAVRLQNLSPPN